MGYIKKIGFGNYRVFKEFNEFELAPISIITGPNNSGKSSFFKGIKLIANNAKDNDLTFLKFNEGTFSSWDTITNNESESAELTAKIGVVSFKKSELDYFVSFINGNIKGISLKKNGELVYSIAFNGYEGEVAKIKVLINISFFKDLIEEEKVNKIRQKETLDILRKGELIETFNMGQDTINQESYEERMSAKNFFTLNIPKIEVSKDKIKKEGKDFLEIPEETESLEIQEYHERFYEPSSTEWENNHILSYLSPEFTLKNIQREFLKSYGYSNEEIQSLLSEEKEGIAVDFDPEFSSLIESFLKGLKKVSLSLNKQISTYSEYLPKFTFKERIVLKKDLPFELDFKKIKNENSVITKFINKHINNFGIGQKFNVREIENFAYAFELVDDDKTYSFSDLGTGYSQIIELLLKIASIGSQSYEVHGGYFDPMPKVLFVEEPEMSLHPSLQSKLADIFADAINLFSIQLIVETHSEYLIRKLQYLVAKKAIQKDSTVIYYFKSKELQKNTPSKIFNRIEINPNGTLTEKFGKGFFDEATNWELELIKLNSIQAN